MCSQHRRSIPKEKGMKIAHLNIRSLRNKRDEFGQFLHNCLYDVMSLSETKIYVIIWFPLKVTNLNGKIGSMWWRCWLLYS